MNTAIDIRTRMTALALDAARDLRTDAAVVELVRQPPYDFLHVELDSSNGPVLDLAASELGAYLDIQARIEAWMAGVPAWRALAAALWDRIDETWRLWDDCEEAGVASGDLDDLQTAIEDAEFDAAQDVIDDVETALEEVRDELVRAREALWDDVREGLGLDPLDGRED
jgi:hypothetical protein